MADCSFARCLQERRLIKRELIKWSKDMLHIVGLERVAEEFMGRRKWKHYQEQLTRIQLNIAEQQPIATTIETDDGDIQHEQQPATGIYCKQTSNHKTGNGQQFSKTLQFERDFDNSYTSQELSAVSRSPSPSPSTSPAKAEPNDWIASEKCNFCVDGRLLTVNAKGELVAETALPTAASNQFAYGNGSFTVELGQQLDSDSNSSASLHNYSYNSKYYNNTNNGHANSNKKPRGRPSKRAANSTAQDNTTGGATAPSSIELYKLLTQQATTMTSMDSMAAQLAAISELHSNFNLINSLANHHQQQQQQQQLNNSVPTTTSDVSAATISPTLKDTASPNADAPLDLSSKPSPNSSISGDQKSVRATSECATPILSARNAYTEEDLKNALQDILAKKVGTRKAATQYNVPRSTLRNKLCKMTLDARPHHQQLGYDVEQDESGDDCEGGDDSNSSTPAPMFQEIAQHIAATTQQRKLSGLSDNNGSDLGDELEHPESPKLAAAMRAQISTPIGAAAANVNAAAAAGGNGGMPIQIDANVLLHTLMLAAGIGVMPKLDESQTLGDLVKTLVLANSGNLINDAIANVALNANAAVAAAAADNTVAAALQNGSSAMLDQHLLLQQLQQHQQQQQIKAAVFRHRLPKSETPETTSSLDTNEACDDPILKIPSFKVTGASSVSPGGNSHHNNNSGSHSNSNSNCNLSRNGGGVVGDQSPHSASPMLAAAVAAATNNSYRQSSSMLSSSPPSIQKMMAITIQRKINEENNQEAAANMLGLGVDSKRNNGNTSGSECSSSGGGGGGGAGGGAGGNSYKKPSISVAKIIGGTDTSRFGASPNLLAQQHHGHLPMHHAHQLSLQDAAGKGTRPKRGKYRNYDRDSLVEAVKAVQRGEMSVHRAGSYYGVPHSTLEYKVKERHLMRPRKREPKPQPDLVGLTGPANKVNPNIPGLNHLDKLKAGNSSSKLNNALKNNSQTAAAAAAAAATTNAPNGIKLPVFDAAVPFQPNMFWPTPSGHNYGLDFNRNTEFLKSQLAETMRLTAAGTSNNAGSSSNSPLGMAQNHPGLTPMKIALEFTEHMYDGIIRKKLTNSDGSGSTGNGNALLDQLLVKKTALPFTNNRSNDYAASCPAMSEAAEAVKRSGSPLGAYADIKRERLSPGRGSPNSASSRDEPDDDDQEHHSNNNNNSEAAHNKNKSNKCNNGSNSNKNGRSRITSRDSETDASSLKSDEHEQEHELSHSHAHAHSYQHNLTAHGHAHSSNKLMDLNGGVKHELHEPDALPNSSILHEKLAQIKAEQAECVAGDEPML